MRMMGAESVEYHRATVLGRVDDHPGRAMEYYASRGETPLVWGGSGASSLGLAGAVTSETRLTRRVFGPGGARDPRSGERLVQTRRPGMEIVIAAHKSVAELGVIGQAEDMHRIMDAERDATLAYLDNVTRQMGGRRGQAAEATPTAGLVYAHTRHATSRLGDPAPHDHVLLANVVEMKDEQGGWKGADTALWREHLHAATMAGRVASARVAVELGYGIEADPGPSGRLGHWRIAGVPAEVMELHSKRAAQIEAECRRRGETTYQARSVAARTTRKAKGHETEGKLVSRWRAELAEAGWPVERLAASVDAARQGRQAVEPLGVKGARALVQSCSAARATWPGARSFPAGTWSWPWPRTSSGRTRAYSSAWSTGHWSTPWSSHWSAWPERGSGPTRWRRCWPGRAPSPRAWPASWSAPTGPSPPRKRGGRYRRGRKDHRSPAVGRAALGRRRHLHLGTRGGAGRGRGRCRQDHHAPGGSRSFRALRPPGARHRHLGPGGPQPGHRGRYRRVAHPGQLDLEARPRPARAQRKDSDPV